MITWMMRKCVIFSTQQNDPMKSPRQTSEVLGRGKKRGNGDGNESTIVKQARL
jgi:hypothetical protein